MLDLQRRHLPFGPVRIGRGGCATCQVEGDLILALDHFRSCNRSESHHAHDRSGGAIAIRKPIPAADRHQLRDAVKVPAPEIAVVRLRCATCVDLQSRSAALLRVGNLVSSSQPTFGATGHRRPTLGRARTSTLDLHSLLVPWHISSHWRCRAAGTPATLPWWRRHCFCTLISQPITSDFGVAKCRSRYATWRQD